MISSSSSPSPPVSPTVMASALSSYLLSRSARAAPGSVSLCSIRDAEQGIYEYLAEKHEPPPPIAPLAPGSAFADITERQRDAQHHALYKPFSVPVRISGWLWRREGLFRKYKRRFGVFEAATATLSIYSSDDISSSSSPSVSTTTGTRTNAHTAKLLSRFVVTQVTLTARESREFAVLGYVQERELYKKQQSPPPPRDQHQSQHRRHRTLPGDQQRFFLPEHETLRAVSDKSLHVWTHCFRSHMKSPVRRRRLERSAAAAMFPAQVYCRDTATHDSKNGKNGNDSGDDDAHADAWDGAYDSDGSVSSSDDSDANPDFQFAEPERQQQLEQQRRQQRQQQRYGSSARMHQYGRQGIHSRRQGEDAVAFGRASDENEDAVWNDEAHDPTERIAFDHEQLLRITASYDALPSTTFFESERADVAAAIDSSADTALVERKHSIPGSQSTERMPIGGSASAQGHAAPSTVSLRTSDLDQSIATTSHDQSDLLQALLQSQQDLLLSSLSHSIWADDELLSFRIDSNAIRKTQQLAVGAFGEVWRATYHTASEQVVAVKHLRRTSDRSSGDRASRAAIQRFVREIKIHCALEHARVVAFIGVAWTMERDVQLVMEFVAGGDLRAYLAHEQQQRQSRRAFQSPSTWSAHQWRVAVDVIEALVYLHSLSPALLHCDVKSHNVLLDTSLRAKVTDFGLSRYLHMDRDDHTTQQQLADNADVLGTGRWLAPEILTGAADYSIASDVYAFGVVLSEIDTCALPFHDRITAAAANASTRAAGAVTRGDGGDSVLLSENILVHQIMLQGWTPAFRPQCPESVRTLAQQCLAVDPERRPTSLEVAYRLRKAAARSHERADLLDSQHTHAGVAA